MTGFLAKVSNTSLNIIIIVLLATSAGNAIQLDYTGSERIYMNEWELQFVLRSMGEDNFSVRLPFPNYTYIGRWDTYSTHEVSAIAVGMCGRTSFTITTKATRIREFG